MRVRYAVIRMPTRRLSQSCTVNLTCCPGDSTPGSGSGSGGSGSGSGSGSSGGNGGQCDHFWSVGGESGSGEPNECESDIPPLWFYEWIVEHFGPMCAFGLNLGFCSSVFPAAQCVVAGGDPATCAAGFGTSLAEFSQLWLGYRDLICGPHQIGVDAPPEQPLKKKTVTIRIPGARIIRRYCDTDPVCEPCI